MYVPEEPMRGTEFARGGSARRGSGGGESGKSPIRLLVPMLALLAVAYAGALVIPVVVSTFRFSQAMDAEVLQGSIDEPAVRVRRRLVAEAERLGLPIAPEQINVTKSGPRYEIEVDYVVPIHIVGDITYDWRFRPHKAGTRRSTRFVRD